MHDILRWITTEILPFLMIAFLTGLWSSFRKVERLQVEFNELAKDLHTINTSLDKRTVQIDDGLRRDIKDIQTKVIYISENYISRNELSQHLAHINQSIDRVIDAINKLG